jgi:hypothetical protein
MAETVGSSFSTTAGSLSGPLEDLVMAPGSIANLVGLGGAVRETSHFTTVRTRGLHFYHHLASSEQLNPFQWAQISMQSCGVLATAASSCCSIDHGIRFAAESI